MQQCGEPHTLALSRRSAHGDKPVRRGVPTQCPGRGRLATVPLGRGPFLHGLRRGQTLFVRPLHRSYSLVRLLIRVHAHRSAAACMSRSGVPLRTRMRSPSFRTKDVSTSMGSSTARGSSSASHLRGEDVAFSSRERDRHLGIRPVSLLDTQPMVSPCERFKLSLAASPCITQDRGGWLGLTPWKTLTSYPLPTKLAHSLVGHQKRRYVVVRFEVKRPWIDHAMCQEGQAQPCWQLLSRTT